MSTYKILNAAAKAGQIILENGGEIYRVEDTISRFCTSFGVETVNAFVMPTGIMVSATDKNGVPFSIVKRIHKRAVDLNKVIEINNLSRKISQNPISIEEVEDELSNIQLLKKLNTQQTIFWAGIGAGSFVFLFNGNFNDAIFTFFIGALLKLITLSLERINFNDFFVNLTGGAFSALIGLLLSKTGLISSMDTVIISSIMLLVPGLLITNAIRDTIAGDLVSGITRTLEAFFIAVAIAVGTGVVFKIWLALGGVL